MLGNKNSAGKQGKNKFSTPDTQLPKEEWDALVKLEIFCLACKQKICGIPIKRKKLQKFCDVKCQQKFIYTQSIEKWLNGEIPGGTVHRVAPFVRKWLKETYGNKCMSQTCGWDWSKPCGLEVEHKDGNSNNHRPENLMLICPNCHSQTDTYKNKNKGNGRAYRRERYAKGKSY